MKINFHRRQQEDIRVVLLFNAEYGVVAVIQNKIRHIRSCRVFESIPFIFLFTRHRHRSHVRIKHNLMPTVCTECRLQHFSFVIHDTHTWCCASLRFLMKNTIYCMTQSYITICRASTVYVRNTRIARIVNACVCAEFIHSERVNGKNEKNAMNKNNETHCDRNK